MKKCQDIENLLPLYREGVLSDAEKRAVEEHLAGCERCQKELAYLQKAGQIMGGLPAVEEPPWFQQKIMARVRAEADQKKATQRWYYPLRIKIPVQIMATIVIAVLAVYIYRSGDEQVKQILPGAPMPAAEMQKESPPLQMPQAEDKAQPAVSRKKAAVPEDKKQGQQAIGGIVTGDTTQKAEAPESKIGAVREANANKTKGFKESKDEAYPAHHAKQNETESMKLPRADQAKKADDHVLPGTAKKKEAYKMAAPAAPPSMAASATPPQQASVIVCVDDLNAAEGEVVKILAKYNAKEVAKQSTEGRILVQADMSGRDWKGFLAKLKEIGVVQEKIKPANPNEGGMHVLIELRLNH